MLCVPKDKGSSTIHHEHQVVPHVHPSGLVALELIQGNGTVDNPHYPTVTIHNGNGHHENLVGGHQGILGVGNDGRSCQQVLPVAPAANVDGKVILAVSSPDHPIQGGKTDVLELLALYHRIQPLTDNRPLHIPQQHQVGKTMEGIEIPLQLHIHVVAGKLRQVVQGAFLQHRLLLLEHPIKGHNGEEDKGNCQNKQGKHQPQKLFLNVSHDTPPLQRITGTALSPIADYYIFATNRQKHE